MRLWPCSTSELTRLTTPTSRNTATDTFGLENPRQCSQLCKMTTEASLVELWCDSMYWSRCRCCCTPGNNKQELLHTMICLGQLLQLEIAGR
jgi:hypothetical protein